MSTIRPVELDMVDLVFRGGERGYILNFSNRTFGEFFALELDVDIDAEIYKREGTSKGKRLRGFLTIVDDGTAAKTLRLLWDYRDAMLKGFNQDDPVRRQEAGLRSRSTSRRHGDGNPDRPGAGAEALHSEWSGLLTQLLGVRDLPAQGRGYAFEAYLKELFDAFGMAAREPSSSTASRSTELSSRRRDLSAGSEVAQPESQHRRASRLPRQNRAEGRMGAGPVRELRRIHEPGARRLR
jgi:hypothetical protein